MAERRRTPEEIERSMRAARDLKAKQTLKEQRNNIRFAQYALIAIGIIQFLLVTILISFGARPQALLVDIVIGVMFIGLYFLSREKPALAFNIAIIAYGVIQLLVWISNKTNTGAVFSFDLSLLIKGIIFMTLFSGARALKRIPKSLMKKSSDDEILDHQTNTKDLE